MKAIDPATLAGTRVHARYCEGEQRHVIYECENCAGFHSWDLDCRNDANRYASKDDYAHRNGLRISDIDTRSMHERTATCGPERTETPIYSSRRPSRSRSVLHAPYGLRLRLGVVAVKPISRVRWRDGFPTDFGPSRGGPL